MNLIGFNSETTSGKIWKITSAETTSFSGGSFVDVEQCQRV